MTLRRWLVIGLLCTMLLGCNNPWSSGDRVLVAKCAYDHGLTGPNRYEVVVFKFPGRWQNGALKEGPVSNNTPVNYIKRLLGMPGELLAIFFGRVYRWTPPEPGMLPFKDDKDARGDLIDARDLWKPEFMHRDDVDSQRRFREGEFEILRKPPRVMLAMRRIVNDNDFQAKDLKDLLRWKPDAKSAWKTDGQTGFTHDGAAEGQVDWLPYKHLLRPDGPMAGGAIDPQLIVDSMAYNSFKSVSLEVDRDTGKRRRSPPFNKTPESPHWVGDLMIECNLEVVQAKGEFLFELNKGIYRYQARWNLASGDCTLKSIDNRDGKEKDLGTKSTNVKSPGNYMLRLANFDSRLTVWVDSALPFGDGADYPPPEVRARNETISDKDLIERRGPTANDLKPASIGTKGAQVKITHMRLWRNTYYTTTVSGAEANAPDSWSDPKKWDRLREPNFSTMYVQPGHYLCLGDNSQASSDSRDWGVVPERLMLGRALVVYFPLDRIGRIR